MQNKKLVLGSLIGFIILFIGLAIFYKDSEAKKDEKTVLGKSDLLQREHSIKFGENKKNISVVEFVDPECESCALFHPILRKLYKEYHEDILLVVKYIPNHKNSEFAIKILEASREQNKYEEVLDIIFEKQALWAQHNNEKPELLWEFLSIIPDLDINKLKEDFKNPKIDKLIDMDKKDSQQLDVRGTPTIFVNGKRLVSLSQKDLFDLVESEIYK
ncbi:MAG: DsbA family protein [Arcobacter sp.]|jgi:protein-disulfide isomerase|uniref:Protein disulfide oxidoreductase, DsbA/G family n=1 Tax=Arcobacter defluvii TaxID=873191 RepID=A0AAE7BFA3_9BACT|nr:MULTISPECIES: thioredoxin domain-containing protein [Arcobacter]MDY3200455.1 thioredoxin domain-containing protein [Arcobacter sp.]QKF77998.1 protein disulfide oxidoreductase, DsbA/G family [Arcobacter defluvii]RXI32773.1 disulfide bond formation protein DsbA [Arcobacter defluvii]BAK73813.1 DSBA-like thioredoxin domain-containing protein [Arcobacter sp. L]